MYAICAAHMQQLSAVLLRPLQIRDSDYETQQRLQHLKRNVLLSASMHCIEWCVTLECSALLPTSAAQALREAVVCGASLVLLLYTHTSYASQLALQRSLCLYGSHALL
jgi:hypothetical protein